MNSKKHPSSYEKELIAVSMDKVPLVVLQSRGLLNLQNPLHKEYFTAGTILHSTVFGRL